MSRTIIVLGMGRSGTSCLAGCLAGSGVDFGKTSPGAPQNPKGFYEMPRIVVLHDKVLKSNRGSWERPPPAPVTWTRRQLRERDRIIDSFKSAPLWGFKDMRILLTLDTWLERLPNAELIGIVRRPSLVWESFQRLDTPLTEREFYALYARYNDLLGYHWKDRQFPILEFGPKFPTAALKVFQSMNLPNPSVDFYERGLHH